MNTFLGHVYSCMKGYLRSWAKIPEARYHESFISLGYNCELAFRYNVQNKFVESGLFHWGYSLSTEGLVFALNHLELLYTGEVLDPNPLYECANTHIYQHGKAPMHFWLPGGEIVPRTVLEADKEDLKGRMAHLKEKFVDRLRHGGALVMYKMRTSEVLAADACKKVEKIQTALKSLGARDFDFVLVLEERCRGKVLFAEKGKDRFFIRFVREFNPDADVANTKLGDFRGWKRIFKEFRPMHRQKKTHKFKFEK